jgi:peptidoglycan/xylan/chitin deacetylase (PgdA/CDA1 family)
VKRLASSAVLAELSLRVARRVRERRSIVLLYHGVGPSNTKIDPGFLRVHPATFRAQLELLLTAGFEFVTVSELAERARGDEPPPGLVALSFDDGMDDNHSVALPIMLAYGVRATVYVVTGLIGKPNPWMASTSGARMMTVDELRDLVSAGFELGAHTVTHPDLSKLDFERCSSEIEESCRALEEMFGMPVRTFAYPFCRYGPAAVAAVRTLGLEAAVTCQGLGSWKPYEMKRTLVSGKDGTTSFVLKLAGLYEPLTDSMPGRLVRAATRGVRTRLRARREAGETAEAAWAAGATAPPDDEAQRARPSRRDGG